MFVLEDAELWVTLGLPGELLCSAPGRTGAGHGLLLLWDPRSGAAGLLQLSAAPGTTTDLVSCLHRPRLHSLSMKVLTLNAEEGNGSF